VDVNIATILEQAADLAGDRPAITTGADVRSWTEFEANAPRLAGFLANRGIGPGSAVALGMCHCPEYLEPCVDLRNRGRRMTIQRIPHKNVDNSVANSHACLKPEEARVAPSDLSTPADGGS
jgi:non-ribosomal peptide synthetase component E (peptide arylation enzyme)